MDEPYCLNIIVRKFIPDLDQAMIYSTWRNGRFYGSDLKNKPNTDAIFKNLTFEITNLLRIATVKIACLEETPTVIVGYVVFHKDHLDWVYVKEDYRKQGVASLLIPANIKTISTTPTKLGAILWAEKNKEKFNGSEENGSGPIADRNT